MPKELLNGGVSSKKEIQKVFLFKTQTLNTRDTKKLPSFSSFRYIFSPHFIERETQERDANGRIRNDLRDGGRRRTRVVTVTVSTTVVFSARGAERTRE